MEKRTKWVSLATLADQNGFSRASMLKTVRRRGLRPVQLSAGTNKPYFLSEQDADAFTKAIQGEKERASAPPATAPNTGGVYCVAVPTYSGVIRYKFGWADNFSERLASYRTIVPDLRIIALWHTSDKWAERMAHRIAAAQGIGVHTELFEFEDAVAAVDAVRQAFNLLGIIETGDGSPNG
jgi:hypothetical protein